MRCPYCAHEFTEREVRSLFGQLAAQKRWPERRPVNAVSPSLPKQPSIPVPRKSAAVEYANLPRSEQIRRMREEQFKKP